MFVHMSIHRPRPDQEPSLIDSMHRFGAALSGHPGLQQVHTLRDEKTGHLIGLAIWESKEAWQAAIPAARAAVKDDDFDSWEEAPPVSYHLEVV